MVLGAGEYLFINLEFKMSKRKYKYKTKTKLKRWWKKHWDEVLLLVGTTLGIYFFLRATEVI